MSHEAYAQAQKSNLAPRDAEYNAFAMATRALLAAEKADRSDVNVLVDAINKNRTLWRLLAKDCASEANQLPEMLRAQIINLSRWVNSYSSDVIRKSESVAPLVDVNRIMMDGLAGQTTAR